ncbi:MAG: hypothetical protein V7L01_13530 [Nostoc sp.]
MNYDINDYKLKVELTRQKLITSAIASEELAPVSAPSLEQIAIAIPLS